MRRQKQTASSILIDNSLLIDMDRIYADKTIGIMIADIRAWWYPDTYGRYEAGQHGSYE